MTVPTPVKLRMATSDTPLPTRDLTEREAAQLIRLPSPARRRAWLTARRALRRALASVGLPQDTSAYTFPHRFASLSYSGGWALAAVVGGDTRDVLGLGVDMEISPGPTPRTAPLFLAEHEQQALATVPLPQWQDELRRVWTTKEALYKADPANQGIDLRRYTLDRPLARHGVARLASAAMPAFRYLTLDLPGGVLTAAVLLSQNGKTTRG